MIPVGKPVMDEREVEAVRRVIRSGWISMGPETRTFEREFAEAVGARFACAVSSGTTALHLALLACGVGPGDEVITVSSSFIATASSIRYCGATPVFVDIEPETFNIDPDQIEAALTPRTRAILCVHQMGMPCNLAAILAIARCHDLLVIEDAACAMGSRVLWEGRWEPVGRPHGDIACWSLHARKVLSTGDGGMLTTNREDMDRLFRLWRDHGTDMAADRRHASAAALVERYEVLGYNYRLTDIQAAIGREQLRRLPDIVTRRRALAARYNDLFVDVQDVTPPSEPLWAQSNWQSYCVRLAPSLDQRTVMQRLRDRGIATRRGIMCAHREPSYPRGTWSCGAGKATCDCSEASCRRLLHSEEAQDHSLILPLYPQMTDDEQHAVVNALREACQCDPTRLVGTH